MIGTFSVGRADSLSDIDEVNISSINVIIDSDLWVKLDVLICCEITAMFQDMILTL